MTDNNKKRTGSFRKLFPNLFFSHKSKEKNTNKNSQSAKKGVTDTSESNQYHNPRVVSIRSDKYTHGVDDNTERIYENLTTTRTQNDNETQSIDVPSNHSSSSTLVSESIKNKSISTIEGSHFANAGEYVHYAARPQVPPKPYNEMIHTSPSKSKNFDSLQYPDVYYHSLEKLTDKISPLDEVEIFKASQAQANPASVGAEIKRVSTKFIISPKKEAEVRTIQPTRARSLSFDNNKEKLLDKTRQSNKEHKQINLQKPYNYSAPTSPIPISHRIPNMPKTVSPYEQLKKTMKEAEEKRNSLNRNSPRNKSAPSPRPLEYIDRSKTPTPTSMMQKDITKSDETEKEKTRQKVEAFYWQKLKELKQMEDEYFLRQSLSSPSKQNTSYSNSNCSTPNSLVKESNNNRSSSLPRGRDLTSYINQPIYSQSPFVRGTPERRTDTYIKSRTPYDQGIMYRRNPENISVVMASPISLQSRKMPIFQRGSLTQDVRGMNQLTKRVSFEEQLAKNVSQNAKSVDLKMSDTYKIKSEKNEYIMGKVGERLVRAPPPPVRTTSVGKSAIVVNHKIFPVGHSVYSESESGSEAGEIRRILQNNTKKGYL